MPSCGSAAVRPRSARSLRARGLEAEVRARTGLLIDAYFSGTKVRWLLDNSGAGMQQRAEAGELAFGTIRLVAHPQAHRRPRARHRRDERIADDAVQPRDGDWDDGMLTELHIPRAMLPHVVDSSGVVAETDAGDLRARDPDRRDCRRPAGGAVRPGLLRGRDARRTRTAPAASSSSTRATRRCSRRTDC